MSGYFADNDGNHYLGDDYKYLLNDAINLLVVTLIHCITGYKSSEHQVCTRKIYPPNKHTPFVSVFESSFYLRHGLTRIELRYCSSMNAYVWRMTCTDGVFRHAFLYFNEQLNIYINLSLLFFSISSLLLFYEYFKKNNNIDHIELQEENIKI